ncbi:S-adenosyl-L-methionine-dependent methyltransferase [Polyplosphaeria fusca]|uniref:S-adenosyl-L-methionine-dependent methyltransferase n=1 Tax=Polyplosphaeria fusca TaxID=682080 RepID=A0A9P4RD16_9PLEO|nr:S-adenosyl-L-methionine-dependent methyltransferase [Polyplosphaeria fusca]
MAQPYLHGHHASVLRSHEWRTVENSAPHLIPYLSKPSLKILDVGCGSGTITVDLASRVPQGFVYGIDPSAEVIEKARNHAADKGVTNVQFEVGDINNWKDLNGVEEQGFDIVHAHQVLQHLQDPLGATKEMKRLIKLGGILAIRDADYSAMQWYPDLPGLREWLDLYITLAKRINCDPNIGKRLHAVAMQAGFVRNEIETSADTWVFSTPEERAFWCGVWAERAVQSNFKTNALEYGKTEDDLQKIVDTFRELEKAEDGWFVILNCQIICHVTA